MNGYALHWNIQNKLLPKEMHHMLYFESEKNVQLGSSNCINHINKFYLTHHSI